jgi:hypothetical protein
MAMKKYLRLIIEVVLGLLLAGALALAYWSYTGKSHVMTELTDASEEVTETQQELEKLTKELAETKEKLEELEPAAKELAAVKDSFSNGVVLQDYEAFIKAQKGPIISERQLGLGALRLLTKGAQDPETVSAFQKALEMAEWTSRLKSICAAQNALAAAGQKVKVLADCASEKDDAHAKKGHAVHWDYAGEMGPENWGDEFPTCGKGQKQSPLNITGPFEKSKDTLVVNYKEGPLKILNNGHTIQVNVEQAAPSRSTKRSTTCCNSTSTAPAKNKSTASPWPWWRTLSTKTPKASWPCWVCCSTKAKTTTPSKSCGTTHPRAKVLK